MRSDPFYKQATLVILALLRSIYAIRSPKRTQEKYSENSVLMQPYSLLAQSVWVSLLLEGSERISTLQCGGFVFAGTIYYSSFNL
jgi:hypothetical protein